MSKRINLKIYGKNVCSKKVGFEKNLANIYRPFLMLLIILIGITCQVNAFSQELDYADKSGKAAEIIKNSEQYQAFLALEKKIAEGNGDRVRKFKVFVDKINSKVYPTDDPISDVRFSGFPRVSIRKENLIKNIDGFSNLIILNLSGYIEYLKISPLYKGEIERVIEIVSKNNFLKGLSIKEDVHDQGVLDLSALSRTRVIRIYKSNYKIVKLPLINELIYLEFLFSPIVDFEILSKATKLKSFVINTVKINDLSELQFSKNLQRLEMEGNEIGIDKTPDLSIFHDLEYLSFNSKYTKNINGIERLDNLKRLYVGAFFDYQKINFPDSLEYLQLAGKMNIKMPNLKGNKNLKILSISRTKIKKIEGLDDLENLEELNLIRNNIRVISGLDQLKNIKKLNLAGNDIENLKNLEEVTLSYNNIENTKGLEKNINLKRIDLEKNKIKKIEAINNLTNLLVVNLVFNPIEEFDYSTVDNLTKTKIRLSDTPVGDAMTKKEKRKYRKLNSMLFF